MRELLPTKSETELLDYLIGFSFIGQVTKYHLARNIGIDVVKPDRPMIRLAAYLSYASPDALVTEISEHTGVRKGTVDFILWQWLALQGSDTKAIRESLL